MPPTPQAPPERSRREKVTGEEIAAACEALLADDHKITIAAVRQRVGGGGNQTVMEGVAAWREARRRREQADPADAHLSDAFRQSLGEEIERHRRAGETQLREQIGELEDVGDVLREELAAASTRAEQLGEQLAEQRAARDALERRASQAEQRMLARQEDAEARLGELEKRLAAQAERLEAARLEAREAGFHADAAQRRRGELDDELGRARLEASGLRQASADHAREAAVVAAKLAGSQELVAVHSERLAAAAADRDRLAGEGQTLRHKLVASGRARGIWARRARRYRQLWRRLKRLQEAAAAAASPTDLAGAGRPAEEGGGAGAGTAGAVGRAAGREVGTSDDHATQQ